MGKRVFRGVTALSLDGKGRLAIPARFRDELQARSGGALVVTADSALCLHIYAAGDWEPIQQKVMNLPNLLPQVRDLQRLLVGMASDVELDSVGRMLVPAWPRRFAGLDKDVCLVGQGTRLELWDLKKWEVQLERSISLNADGIPKELEGFSL